MSEPHYHLHAPTLSPELEGALLGRDVLARHRTSGQAVVLKSYRAPWRSRLTDDHKDALRSIDHPALIAFLRTEPSLGFGTLHAYYAYQFEPLMDAQPAIRDAVGFEPQAYAAAFADVADGLALLHDVGIVHGALNPESLVVTRADGRIRVKDAGLGVHLTENPNEALRQLRPCFPYLPPELFDDIVHARVPEPSVAGDIYALGAVMQGFLFDQPPIPLEELAPGGPDAQTLMLRVLGGEVQLADTWRAEPLLTGIVHRCLHPDPAARYPSMAAVAADLREAAATLVSFVGEDAFGLRFETPGGDEVRVLPASLALAEVPTAATVDGAGADELEMLLLPDWSLDAGTRTIVRTATSGLEPLESADVDLAAWEFHLVQGMAELAVLAPAGPFVSHEALLWADPATGRLFLALPTLRPRAGEEAAFLDWIRRLEGEGYPPIVAPEVLHHAGRLSSGDEEAARLDEILPESAACTSVWVFARLIYGGITKIPPTVDPAGIATPLPLAYHANRGVSVQLSELLARAVEVDPATRSAAPRDVVRDYQRRAPSAPLSAANPVDGSRAS